MCKEEHRSQRRWGAQTWPPPVWEAYWQLSAAPHVTRRQTSSEEQRFSALVAAHSLLLQRMDQKSTTKSKPGLQQICRWYEGDHINEITDSALRQSYCSYVDEPFCTNAWSKHPELKCSDALAGGQSKSNKVGCRTGGGCEEYLNRNAINQNKCIVPLNNATKMI